MERLPVQEVVKVLVHDELPLCLQVQEVVEVLVHNIYLDTLEDVVPPRPAAGFLHRKFGPDRHRAPFPPQDRGDYGGRRRRGGPSPRELNTRARPTQQPAPPPTDL